MTESSLFQRGVSGDKLGTPNRRQAVSFEPAFSPQRPQGATRAVKRLLDQYSGLWQTAPIHGATLRRDI